MGITISNRHALALGTTRYCPDDVRMAPSRQQDLHDASLPARSSIALIGFIAAWAGYAWLVEWTRHGRESLNHRMNKYRETWMRRMLAREMRMVDMQIMAALQNGTAFFASTTLLAIGGTLTPPAHDQRDVVRRIRAAFRHPSDAKFVGGEGHRPRRYLRLRLLQVRLVLPGLQLCSDHARCDAVRGGQGHARGGSSTCCAPPGCLPPPAGTSIRGQRGFFFALGYLGWFVGPIVFMATTAAVVVVMWRRQFVSDSLHSVADD